MAETLRVLVVADRKADVETLRRELQAGGYQPVLRQVRALDELGAALAAERWELVVAAEPLGRCDGRAAVAAAEQFDRDLPIIRLTREDLDQAALEIRARAAGDGVATSRRERLLPAIRRAVAAGAERRALRDENDRLHSLVDRERQATIEILRLVNDHEDFRGLLRAVTGYLQIWTGCSAIGIRLAEGEDFPYYETRGFAGDFVAEETRLCARDEAGRLRCDSAGLPVLECMCGNVLRGRVDPRLPFFTARGSFWTSSTTDLLASSTEADRQARTRNRCNGEGYESVALIPLRVGQETLGLLQCNDLARGRFTADGVAQLERLADSLALALSRRVAADSLRRSQTRYQSLFEDAAIPIWEEDFSRVAAVFQSLREAGVTDFAAWFDAHRETVQECAALVELVAVNRESLHFFGVDSRDHLLQRLPDIFCPESYAAFGRELAALAGGARSFDTEIPVVDQAGQRRELWVRLTVPEDCAESLERVLVSWVDMTDHRRILEQLRLQAMVLDQIQDCVTVTDLAGRITYVNDAAARRRGCPRELLLGQSADGASEAAPAGADPPAIRAAVVRDGTWRGRIDTRAADPSGAVLDARVTAICDPTGRPVATCEVATDITSQVTAEEALQESERRFWTIANYTADWVIWTGPEGRPLWTSPSVAQATGYAVAECLAMPDFPRPLLAPGDHDRLAGLLTGAVPSETGQSPDFQIVRKDGSLAWFSAVQTPVHDQDGRYLGHWASLRNIDDRKHAEEELRHAQRIESVGRLAGGVAHDLNNLLTPIIGYAEFAIEDLAPDDPRRSDGLEILGAAYRARDLTRQLLAFGRRQVLELGPVDVVRVVTGFEKLLRRTLREDVRLDLQLPEASGTVLADVGQLEQVLLNLAINAQDAMPQGGVLTVQVTDGPPEQPGGPPTVELRVADTGCGMDESELRQIFEPFFTTKPAGQGTGLGLAVAHGIIAQHGGTIRVESTVGRGTTFSIRLPQVAQSPAAVETIQVDRSPASPPSATIMVVDDDEGVRSFTARALAREGYQVLTASSGEDCLRRCATERPDFDLLITDVVMTGMTGLDLYQRLVAERPGLPVLFISGYEHQVLSQRGALSPETALLGKPFTPEALRQAVRDLLGQ